MHNASMPNILVRNVPEKVHRTLVRRATANGQSLQQYVAELLTQQASRPTMEEVLKRIESRPGGRVAGATATELLREARREREAQLDRR